MTSQSTTIDMAPRWMKWTLAIAAAYNILWGGFVVLFPEVPFAWIGWEAPRYPELFACIGMIVGVYGVGYGIAARDPFRHWPIVLVGFLGKIFGPIGFLASATAGRLPWNAGWTILSNDLVWWLPFAGILMGAWSAAKTGSGESRERGTGWLARSVRARHRPVPRRVV